MIQIDKCHGLCKVVTSCCSAKSYPAMPGGGATHLLYRAVDDVGLHTSSLLEMTFHDTSRSHSGSSSPSGTHLIATQPLPGLG
jgi:hypothetical protein